MMAASASSRLRPWAKVPRLGQNPVPDLELQGLIRLPVGIGDDVQAYDLVRQGVCAAEPHAQEGCKGHAQEECQLPACFEDGSCRYKS